MPDAIEQAIQEHFARFDTAPFLFVGSGFERRYLGLPDWNGLLDYLASLTGRSRQRYLAEADGDHPATATKIAEQLLSVWWDADQFAASREESAGLPLDSESPLKVETARFIRGRQLPSTLASTLQTELDLLRALTIDGIITTNYSQLLDQLFPDYAVYVGQKALLFNRPAGIAEIFKIHGCVSDPNSIILTARDYRGFEARNPYLAAKLTTIFVEHPVVFLGYSLSDRNIQSILSAVAACLDQQHLTELQDRLIFVDWQADPSAEPALIQSNIKLGESIVPTLTLRTHSYTPLFRGMGRIQRRFPAKLLRQLKTHVYELVQAVDSPPTMHVVGIDDTTDLDEVSVVFGVGAYAFDGDELKPAQAPKGYQMYTAVDIMRDVVFGDPGNLDAMRVLCETIPARLRQNGWLPVHKYVSATPLVSLDALHPKIRAAADRDQLDFLPRPMNYWSQAARFRALGGVKAVIESIDPPSFLHQTIGLLLLDWSTIDHGELRDWLQLNFDALVSHEHATVRASFRKLVCLYDRLSYSTGPHTGPTIPA